MDRPFVTLVQSSYLWLKRNEPQVYAAAHKLAGIHDWMLHRLTGEWLTDTSLASRTSLFDISRLAWSDDLLNLFAIDEAKLCRLVPVGSVCGHLRADVAQSLGLSPHLPVVTAGGDQQCAVLGMGAVEASDVVINSGTGSTIVTPSATPLFDPARRLVCNVGAVPGTWVVEAGILSSGLVFEWFNTLFYADSTSGPLPPDKVFERINVDCAKAPPGARGLIMSPSLSGKGAPYWDAHARGAFHNISFNTRREDFARAILEGIAAELGDGMAALSELKPGTSFSRITCSGGLARSDVFNQILADTLGIPVQLAATNEATCLGAWFSASAALGLFDSPRAALAAVASAPDNSSGSTLGSTLGQRRFAPDAGRHALYQRCNAARRYLYEAVDMHRVNALRREPHPET